MDEDVAREVGHGHIDAGGPQVSGEDVSVRRGKLEVPRGAAPGRRPQPPLDEQTAVQELRHPLGDDRPCQAGRADDVRT